MEVRLKSAIFASNMADSPHASFSNDLVEGTSLIKQFFTELFVEEGLDNKLLSCMLEGNIDCLLSFLYPLFEVGHLGACTYVNFWRPTF